MEMIIVLTKMSGKVSNQGRIEKKSWINSALVNSYTVQYLFKEKKRVRCFQFQYRDCVSYGIAFDNARHYNVGAITQIAARHLMSL